MAPKTPKGSAGGTRQQKAAAMRAEEEAKGQRSEPEIAEPEQAEAVKAEAEIAEAEQGRWHSVQEGETLETIAETTNYSPQTLWDHAANKPLRERSGTSTGLRAGDKVFIPEQQEDAGPVGQGEYIVKEGDSIASVAQDTGHFWETIWNDPGNAELKEVRGDPNVLLPGDRITIPPSRPKEESGETEMRHRFVRKGFPAFYRVQLFDGEEPRANQEYTLNVDGSFYSGTTDAQGTLQQHVPPNAKRGELVIGPDAFRLVIRFGHLDPISELRGVQKRLNNLGYPCGAPDGKLKDRTREALIAFQRRFDLDKTGQPDDATLKKLEEIHDDVNEFTDEQSSTESAGAAP